MSLREQILSINDIQKETVTVPAWGVDIEVRGMTGAQRAQVIADATVRTTDADGKTHTSQDQAILYPRLIIETAYDPATGTRIFSAADRDAIGEKSAGVLEEVAMVACRLSGITPDSVTVIRKNSATTPSDASPSV